MARRTSSRTWVRRPRPREIGPAAKAAVPALKKVMDNDVNDEVAASAKQALRRIDPSAIADEK
jgi:hypothetical protein